MSHQNILVTGTNSGFGKLIVHSLARKGHTVFATMRDAAGRNRGVADEYQALAAKEGLKIHVLDMELTSDESVNAAVRKALDQASHLDVVVNNAGFGLLGLEETITSAQLIEQFDINVVAPHRVLRAVLPSMRSRGKGFLIHVSSGLGRLVVPFMGAYCASKFALEALAESYSYELSPLGIETTIVQPGPFPTGIINRMPGAADLERVKSYGPMADAPQQFMAGFEQMFDSPNPPVPQDVADAILELVESPAGSRPLRVVVDKFMGDAPRALNQAHEQVQNAMLTNMGIKK